MQKIETTTVKQLIEELRRLPQDARVLVGHEKHDYCMTVEADVPEIVEGFVSRERFYDEWQVIDEEEADKRRNSEDYEVDQVVVIR